MMICIYLSLCKRIKNWWHISLFGKVNLSPKKKKNEKKIERETDKGN